MPTIYVLKCRNNRYYVGKTNRLLEDRISEHFASNGSEWTKRYTPIEVIETKTDADEFDEDKYTKKYMKLYGIDRVRGGSYTQLVLPEYSVLALEKELCSASDLCFRCKRPGHFAGQCYAKTRADGSMIYHEESNDEEYWSCAHCDKEFDCEYEASKHKEACKKRDKKHSFLPKLFNTALKIIDQFLEDEKPKEQACFRCGRTGHYTNDCYARTHANGKKL